MYIALILLYLISLNQLSRTRILAFSKRNHKESSSILRANKVFYGYSVITSSALICFIFLTAQLLYKFTIGQNVPVDRIIRNFYLSFIILPFFAFLFIKPNLNTRIIFEKSIKYLLLLLTLITCSIIILVIFLLLSDTIKFFNFVPIRNFLLGINWNPQNSLNYKENLGIIPLLSGTFLITMIAVIIASPIGVLSSIFISEYLNKKYTESVKSTVEILAGIPTVVYGYIAALFVSPKIRMLGNFFDLNISSESAIAAGIVMGVMLIPYIMSLSYEFIKTVPNNLKDASIAMGSTKEEMITGVLIPSAFPGILGGIIMAVSRAVGETMIVTMAAGLIAKLTLNPLHSVTTITAQIVSIISGDQEFDSPQTLSAFALAFVLFLITLFLNIIAHRIVKNFQQKIGYNV